MAGRFAVDESLKVEMPGNASVALAEMDGRRWDRLGVRSHVTFAMLGVGGETVARNTLILPMYREMTWPAEMGRLVVWRVGNEV